MEPWLQPDPARRKGKVKTEITPDMIIAEDSDGTDCEGAGIYRYIEKFEEESVE